MKSVSSMKAVNSKANISSLGKRTTMIKAEAKRLGFLSCGIAKADFLEEEAPRLEKWLNQNMHGEMKYMENHFDKRLDPRLLVDDAKSVISLLLNYFPSETQKDPQAPKLSQIRLRHRLSFCHKGQAKTIIKFYTGRNRRCKRSCFCGFCPRSG